MAKGKDIKPFFPLKHEFVDSLDKFVQESTMLALIVGQALRADAVSAPFASELQKQLDAYNAARAEP